MRCQLCGTYFTAPLSEEVAQQGRYTPRCRATLAFFHYYLGLPFKRIELAQKLQGVPFPDATAWDRIEELYDVVAPIYQTLVMIAPEAEQFSYDDTPNAILFPEKIPDHRKGIYTTAITARFSTYTIYLFYTSHQYAGENLDSLLSDRQSDDLFLTMCDASSMNLPSQVDEKLYHVWVMCCCLIHGRRKFYELQDEATERCGFMLDELGKVYSHDAHCKEQNFTPQQRLAHHQQHSAPIMYRIKTWLNNLLLHKEVEPNSNLGRAISHMLRYWLLFTRFLHYAGAPLDNSDSERTLKIIIRLRKASLRYRTDHGAEVGDAMTSIIHTAARSNVNVIHYLSAIQKHREAVAEEPHLWLPWAYEETLEQLSLHDPPQARAA